MTVPTLTVRFAPNAIASAGTTFILDVSQLDTGTLGAGIVWADISAYVRSFSASRGRQRALDRFGAGTCSLVLDNRDRRFDPTNLNGPYASLAAGVTGVTPNRPIEITATWNGVTYPIFRGFIDSWSFDYDQSVRDATVSVQCTDAFKLLAGPLGGLPTAQGFTEAANYSTIPQSAPVTFVTIDESGVTTGTSIAIPEAIGSIADVAVGGYPCNAALSPDELRLYVVNDTSDNVSVVNTQTNTVTATVAMASLTAENRVAVRPDGLRAYITCEGANQVKVLDTTTNTVSATVTVGTAPRRIAILPNGSKAYVNNVTSGNVSVINLASNTVSSTITVGTTPAYGIAASPDGTRVYCLNYGANTVSVINTATDAVIATVTVGTGPGELVVSPDNSRVYVVNVTSNNVSVIDTTTNTVTATVAVGTNPRGIAITPNGSKVVVANRSSANATVINTATNTVAATVTLGTTPYDVAINNRGTQAFVTCTGARQVQSINLSTLQVSNRFSTSASPIYAVVNRSSTRIYALASNANIVNVLADQSENLGTYNIPVVGDQLQTPAYGGLETTGQRIYRLLSEAGYNLAQIDTGTTYVVPQKVERTVLEMMQEIADSDPGDLYVDAAGVVRFDDRNALYRNSRSTTVQATFDATTQTNPFYSVNVAYDDDLIYNIYRVTRYEVDPTLAETSNPVSVGTTVTVTNPESQALYGARTYERRLPIPTTVGDNGSYGDDVAQDFALMLASIYSTPELRPASIELRPGGTPNALFPQALGREVNDRVNVKFAVPGGGAAISRDCFIDGVAHEASPGFWRTVFTLRSATQYTGFFILDSSTLGVLDTNKLAF